MYASDTRKGETKTGCEQAKYFGIHARHCVMFALDHDEKREGKAACNVLVKSKDVELQPSP